MDRLLGPRGGRGHATSLDEGLPWEAAPRVPGRRTLSEMLPPATRSSPAPRDAARAMPGGARPTVDDLFGIAAAGPVQDVPYRGEMERAFGRDLSGAKAVLGRAAELAAIGAAAATRGDTIVFGATSP